MATSGDILLATREDFYMATDRKTAWLLRLRDAGKDVLRGREASQQVTTPVELLGEPAS